MNESPSVLNLLKRDPNYLLNLEQVRKDEFSRLSGSTTYLDHAAYTLYSENQLEAIFRTFQSSVFGNPHSRHDSSHNSTEIIESVRNFILTYFKTSEKEYALVFTSGATEAIKIVANCFLWGGSSRESKARGVYAYTQENHSSILGVRELADKKGVSVYCLGSDTVEDILQNDKEETSFSIHPGGSSSAENCLFAYPAQCNFSGSKYSLTWIDKIQDGKLNLRDKSPINFHSEESNHLSTNANRKWFVLLDAAGFVSTSTLDLSRYTPDFVPISFYKIFGYPTGLGCLLVSKRAWNYLSKPYFGGGTVKMADSRTMDVKFRDLLHERFEDGTLPFLDIISLKDGFNCLLRITGGIANIETHVFNLSRYLAYNLRSLRHGNNTPVVEVYSRHRYLTEKNHGSIVNFNIKSSEGTYIGYSQVEKMSSVYNIHLRTGCVCNPGACQKYLRISPQQLQTQFRAGHVCGDAYDLVDGMPTGSVRVSFGYMNTYEDADIVLKMIKECFVEKGIIVDTSWIDQEEIKALSCSLSQTSFCTPKDTSTIFCNVSISNSTRIHSTFTSEIDDVPQREEKTSSKIEKVIFCEDNQKRVAGLCQNNLNSNKLYHLTDIVIYPIKSCAGLSLLRWNLGSCGLAYDRQWMITAAGVTLTQKRVPRLSLIKPSFLGDTALILSCKNYGSVQVSLDAPTENGVSSESIAACGGRVCGEKVKGLDCGSEVAEWLSKVLQMNQVRLIRQILPRKCKLTPGKAEESLSLANESQYLAIHRPSVRLLLRQMQERDSSAQIPEDELILRFRPNFVIDGGEPYEEDEWKFFTIGDHNFTVLGKCVRCQMICMNPETGERSKEPMATLGSTRGSLMPFGIHSSYIPNSSDKLNDQTNECDLNVTKKCYLSVDMSVTVEMQDK